MNQKYQSCQWHPTQSYNRYGYVFNNPLKYVNPTGYKSKYYRDWDYSGFTPPPCHGGYGWNFYYNYIAPPLGSGISSFAGNIGDPFSIGGGSWVNSFGKYTYQQSLNLRFWNSLTSQILNYGHDYNVTPISAFGRITFVGSFGPLGKWIINNNGAISFENPTSGVHLSVANVVSSRVKYDTGGNWSEIGSAAAGLVLGVIEIGAGVGGKLVTGGVSTILTIDGVVRVGSNGVKLYLLISGNFEAGIATPSNTGGWIGKSIDMATGTPYNEISYGQGLGSFTNDFTTFVVTGGSAVVLSQSLMYPSVWTIGSYGAVLTLTPYTAFSDALNWYKFK